MRTHTPFCRRGGPTGLLAGLAVAVVFAWPLPLKADPAGSEVTPAGRAAAVKGVAWLLVNQNPDGSWGCKKSQAPSTAITALACLALMSEGSTPERGPHRGAVSRGLEYTLSAASRSGLITANDTTGMGMLYDHACATLFLAEAYATSADPGEELRRKLGRAVQAIARLQNGDGGWGAPGSDVATTASMWIALRAAHNAGVTVHGPSMEKVEAFVRSCAEPDGRFAQAPGLRGGGGHVFFPTAAALRVLYGAGRHDDPAVRAGTRRVMDTTLGQEYGGRISEWDYCGAFYATQALLQENGKAWDAWFPAVRDRLVKLQNEDGSWTIEYCLSCQAYATALAVLVLETPGRMLPVLQL